MGNCNGKKAARWSGAFTKMRTEFERDYRFKNSFTWFCHGRKKVEITRSCGQKLQNKPISLTPNYVRSLYMRTYIHNCIFCTKSTNHLGKRTVVSLYFELRGFFPDAPAYHWIHSQTRLPVRVCVAWCSSSNVVRPILACDINYYNFTHFNRNL